MHRRAKLAHRLIKNSKLVLVPNTKHNIALQEYQQTLKRHISSELK